MAADKQLKSSTEAAHRYGRPRRPAPNTDDLSDKVKLRFRTSLLWSSLKLHSHSQYQTQYPIQMQHDYVMFSPFCQDFGTAAAGIRVDQCINSTLSSSDEEHAISSDVGQPVQVINSPLHVTFDNSRRCPISDHTVHKIQNLMPFSVCNRL